VNTITSLKALAQKEEGFEQAHQQRAQRPPGNWPAADDGGDEALQADQETRSHKDGADRADQYPDSAPINAATANDNLPASW
jgi:hypothetical protein